MQLNYNGNILSETEVNLKFDNRAFKYGDAIFDTLKYSENRIEFLEDHYFRLMSSMRMLRMKIPMHVTLEFYESEILKVIKANQFKTDTARIRVSIFRRDGGLYLPEKQGINFLIEAKEHTEVYFDRYEIELYKDFPVFSGMLSNLKTTNRLLNVVASIYADENDYQNCVLLNEKKNIVEAIQGNIFLIKGTTVFTPALTEGCIQGIIRKKLIAILQKHKDFTIVETAISPFELLKAEEVFITNSITHIQSVTNYRKKEYQVKVAKKLRKLLAIEKLI